MPDFDRSFQLIREGERIIKGPDLFWRKAGDEEALGTSGGELRVMRRWNSHTPTVYDVFGGGYLLRWGGKGTVIDPGCCFLKLFRSKTHYNIGDIDMVVTTHDHLDHCQDLAALITLFREYNNWSVEPEGKPPKVWDMICSYGVAEMYKSMIEHPDNAPFLFWQRVLPNDKQEIKCRQDIPSFLRKAREQHLLDQKPNLLSYCSEAEEEIADKYSYHLSVLPAHHKELLGKMTSFGLRIKLSNTITGAVDTQQSGDDLLPTIVISGDTAINGSTEDNHTDGKHLSRLYDGADLLILHVGGIEAVGQKRYRPGGHLGIQGIVEVLTHLETNPKLVVLTEWGYEFGRIGTRGRTAFVLHIVERLKAEAKGNLYFAAVGTREQPLRDIPENGIPIIPADIGLRIRLPDLAIECSEKGFMDCRNVYAREILEEIEYCCIS